MNYFLDELNSIQREAAKSTEGPVMIIAGAGSGKTRVLTSLIAHLIEKNVALGISKSKPNGFKKNKLSFNIINNSKYNKL